jgi:hypothetical protein
MLETASVLWTGGFARAIMLPPAERPRREGRPMHDFYDLIREWQTFYATLALACATLIGLLFIALTINQDVLRKKKNVWRLRIARKAFGDFLLVLMTSIMFLVPRLPPVGLAAALFALGVAWSFGVIARLVMIFIREKSRQLSVRKVIRVFLLSFIGGIGLTGVAIALWLEYTDVLYWLVAVFAALIASASATSWTLLMQED